MYKHALKPPRNTAGREYLLEIAYIRASDKYELVVMTIRTRGRRPGNDQPLEMIPELVITRGRTLRVLTVVLIVRTRGRRHLTKLLTTNYYNK
jgi:hypothetical protein